MERHPLEPDHCGSVRTTITIFSAKTVGDPQVLEIEEIKSLPYVPMSHPFVERLIGSIRRELLDQTFFWTASDSENKLRAYQVYYNEHRCHSGRYGATPADYGHGKVIDISNYRWKKHCRGLFQLPVAA